MQVFNPVVLLVPIAVMDYFIRMKRSAEMLRHHMPVFINHCSIGPGENDVSSGIDATANRVHLARRAVALLGTEPRSVPSNPGRIAIERGSALFTYPLNLVLSIRAGFRAVFATTFSYGGWLEVKGLATLKASTIRLHRSLSLRCRAGAVSAVPGLFVRFRIYKPNYTL